MSIGASRTEVIPTQHKEWTVDDVVVFQTLTLESFEIVTRREVLCPVTVINFTGFACP